MIAGAPSHDAAIEAGDGVDADAHAAVLIRRSFLTGLPTRQVLHEHLELALVRADRDGDLVALLDIDRFRSVNDAVGHAGGDVVLAQVANRLRECCPAGELLLHSGAEEFLLMLTGLEARAAEAEVAAVAQTIADALAAPFEVAAERVEVRASIGYALGPVDGGDPEELHRSAHSALAAAKAAGARGAVSLRPRCRRCAAPDVGRPSAAARDRERSRHGSCPADRGPRKRRDLRG